MAVPMSTNILFQKIAKIFLVDGIMREEIMFLPFSFQLIETMANYGQGMSAIGRYVGDFFDNGLPGHMSLLLTGQAQSVRRKYGVAVIEKVGGDNRPVQLRSQTIWFSGVTFAFDVAVEDDPFFSYRLAVWWDVKDEPFFWYHS